MKRIIIFIMLYVLTLTTHAKVNYDITFTLPDNTIIYLYNLDDFNDKNRHINNQTIESYIIAFNIDYIQVSNNNMFKQLNKGTYYCSFKNDDYHIEPILIKLDDDVHMSPKIRKKVNQSYNLTVDKEWVGSQKDQVKIYLYENNKLIQTKSLSKQNNYTCCFENLNDLNTYIITEEINKDYHYIIVRNNNHIVITNYELINYLPQTGISLLSLVLFFIIGTFFIVIGVLMKNE